MKNTINTWIVLSTLFFANYGSAQEVQLSKKEKSSLQHLVEIHTMMLSMESGISANDESFDETQKQNVMDWRQTIYAGQIEMFDMLLLEKNTSVDPTSSDAKLKEAGIYILNASEKLYFSRDKTQIYVKQKSPEYVEAQKLLIERLFRIYSTGKKKDPQKLEVVRKTLGSAYEHLYPQEVKLDNLINFYTGLVRLEAKFFLELMTYDDQEESTNNGTSFSPSMAYRQFDIFVSDWNYRHQFKNPSLEYYREQGVLISQTARAQFLKSVAEDEDAFRKQYITKTYDSTEALLLKRLYRRYTEGTRKSDKHRDFVLNVLIPGFEANYGYKPELPSAPQP